MELCCGIMSNYNNTGNSNNVIGYSVKHTGCVNEDETVKLSNENPVVMPVYSDNGNGFDLSSETKCKVELANGETIEYTPVIDLSKMKNIHCDFCTSEKDSTVLVEGEVIVTGGQENDIDIRGRPVFGAYLDDDWESDDSEGERVSEFDINIDGYYGVAECYKHQIDYYTIFFEWIFGDIGDRELIVTADSDGIEIDTNDSCFQFEIIEQIVKKAKEVHIILKRETEHG